MNGKIVGIVIVGAGLLAGAAIYYLQVYGYYRQLDPGTVDLHLTANTTGEPAALETSDVQAIDADSSPLRFRACFTTPTPLATLAETATPYPEAEPLTGPGWFDCYDARAVGEALEQGRATAFLGQREIHDGVDRVIAVFDDGRAVAWHQLNEKYKD